MKRRLLEDNWYGGQQKGTLDSRKVYMGRFALFKHNIEGGLDYKAAV